MAAASDFGLFDVQTRAYAVLSVGANDATAFTMAEQATLLAANRISVAGGLSANAHAEGAGTSAEADTFSDAHVDVELTEPQTVRLMGTAESIDFGQVSVTLTGPGVSFLALVQGAGELRKFDEEFMLDSGEYSFRVSTFADTEVTNGGVGGQFAMWDLELSLIECEDPPEPMEITALYGVNGQSDTVHSNPDLAGGADWGSPGNMGSPASSAHGLAVHPPSGGVYVLIDASGTDFLGTIDPATGDVTSTMPITHTDSLAAPGLLDIAFDADGTMYCVYELIIPGTGVIGTVDLGTGQVSDAGLDTFNFAGTTPRLAVDPDSGLLFLSTGTTLFVTPPDTGNLTAIPLTNPREFTSLAFHPSGMPFLACGSTGEIVEIDLLTGMVDSVPAAMSSPAVFTGLDFVTTTVGGGDPICTIATGDLGDTDRDGMVSSGDLDGFVDCMTGPNGGIPSQSSCLHADMQTDGDVDLADYAEFAAVVGTP